MKKLISVFAAAVVLVASAVQSFSAPLNVVVTIPDLADITTRVGGDKVSVFGLASGVEDPHNVMIRPSMITKLAQADLFIVLGLDLEHSYAPALVAESRNQKIQPGSRGYLDCSKAISVRDVPKSVDRTQGDVHPDGNPHYNTDPGRMRLVVNETAERLAELDPANAAFFKANAQAYVAILDAKIKEWTQKLAGKKIKFVSYHPMWPYFEDRFGVQSIGTIQPKPGIEPGPRYVEELIGRMKAENVKLVVKESFFSDRIPKQIAAATGARLVSVPIQVNGTKDAKDYIAFIDTVVNAFAGTE